MTKKLEEKVRMKKKVGSFNERLAGVVERVGNDVAGASAGLSKLSGKPSEIEKSAVGSIERLASQRPVTTAASIDHSYSSTHNTANNSYSAHNNSYSSHNNSYNASATAPSYTANNSYNGNNFDRWNASMNHPSIHYESSSNDGLLIEQLNNVKRDYEALKARYAELSKLRNTEAEEALAEHRRLSEARDAAAERTIKSLQSENERLKRELAQARQEAPLQEAEEEEEDSVSKVLIQEKEEKISEMAKLIKIYSGFSGLKIEASPEDLAVWKCTFSSRSGRFQFTLRHDSASNRYQYLPSASSASKAQLPEFLTTDILIGADQMQIFFWRMLDTLTKQ